jgi:hypothetical protein
MKQCVLRKGTREQQAYIPAQFAVEGNFVRVKGEDGWEVLEASSVSTSSEYVLSHRDDHRGAFESLKAAK